MSMICWVLGLTPAQIDALRASPSLASDVANVTPRAHLKTNVDEMLKRMSPEQRKVSEPQFRAWANATAEAQARLAGLGPFEAALDLEKSWHILHYVFTGEVGGAEAPGDALLSGDDLGDDVGYGPARLHDAARTRALHRFLETLDVVALQARVNFQHMGNLGIYRLPMGSGSDATYEEELRSEIATYFPLLRDYVAKMSEKENGLLTWLS
jgi:hypothetical protein